MQKHKENKNMAYIKEYWDNKTSRAKQAKQHTEEMQLDLEMVLKVTQMKMVIGLIKK